MVDNKKLSRAELRLQAFERSFLRAHPLPPPRGCLIGWQPTALAPVFYGVRDYGPSDRAPSPLRVFFPSLDGAVFSAPILIGCGRYPVILFAHGHCNGAVEHYKQWYLLPAQLARSGYIVVVPHLANTASGVHPSANDADLNTLASVLQWIGSTWEHQDAVMPAPATGIVGHSFGAVLSARFASGGGIVAYASLSGVHSDFPMRPFPIETLNIPKLFIMGGESDLFTNFSDAFWNSLSRPKYRAVFTNGQHFDYLPTGQTPCDQSRGPCQLVAGAAADLVTMFFANYLPPELTTNLPDQVSDDLIPPASLVLTPEQQFYAGSHLNSFRSLQGLAGCEVTLESQLLTDREVPYVRFLPRDVADREARNADLVPQFIGPAGGSGTPWVFTQSPAGGTVVSAGSTLRMTLRRGEIP